MNIQADYYHSARTRQIFAQLIRVTCPSDAETMGLIHNTVDMLERSMQSCPPHIRNAQLVGINAFEELARLDPRHLGKSFSELDRRTALIWFDRWWHSDFRLFKEFARLIKTMITAEYYELPPVRRQVEYHPDRWIAKVAARRLNRYGDAIRRKEAENLAPDPLIVEEPEPQAATEPVQVSA